MGKVDLLLTRLSEMGGDALVIASRRPIEFHIGGEVRPLAPAPLRDADIVMLLGEVLPPSERAAFSGGRDAVASFPYTTPSGLSVGVTIEKQGSSVSLRLDLSPPEELEPEPPPRAEVDMSLPEVSEGEFEIESPSLLASATSARQNNPSAPSRSAPPRSSEPGPDFEFRGNLGEEEVEAPRPPPSQGWKQPPPPVTPGQAPVRTPSFAPEPLAPFPPPVAQPSRAAPPAAAPAPARPPAAAPAPVRPAPPQPSAAPARRPAGGAGPQMVAFLRTLMSVKGSDLHLASHSPPRIRLNGKLNPLQGEGELSPDIVAAMVDAILDETQRERFARDQSVDFAFDLSGVGRFRANAVVQRRGCNLVFRTIPTVVPTPEELGLPKAVEALTKYPNGLVLITGPAGCGKSTTVASLVDRINETRTDHIITVEDPVEYIHQPKGCLVNQRGVGTHVRTFAEALKSALREDPDVIVVGEMRDLETIQLAITAAETGHLVLGTLHTVDAGRTIDRMIDVFPGAQRGQIRGMVSESLRGIISQQLLPAADGSGRLAAFEVLLADRSISNLIREAKTFQIPNLIRLGRARGMMAMDDAVGELVLKGKVTQEAALAATDNPDSLKKIFATAAGKAAAAAAAAAAAPKRPNAGR